MKSLKEIKLGLALCGDHGFWNCISCPYRDKERMHCSQLKQDALQAINDFESTLQKMSEVASVLSELVELCNRFPEEDTLQVIKAEDVPFFQELVELIERSKRNGG